MKKDSIIAFLLIGSSIAFYIYYKNKNKSKALVNNNSDETGDIFTSNQNGTISPKGTSNEYDVSGKLVKCVTAPCYDSLSSYGF